MRRLLLLTDSDIIHLSVAGTSLVVLDTSEAATELLEKRSSIYSDRYLFVVAVSRERLNVLTVLLEPGCRWSTS